MLIDPMASTCRPGKFTLIGFFVALRSTRTCSEYSGHLRISLPSTIGECSVEYVGSMIDGP